MNVNLKPAILTATTSSQWKHDGGFADLATFSHHDDVRAGDVLGVEPVVCLGCGLQRQHVVFFIVASNQDRETVAGFHLLRLCLEFLWLDVGLAAADVARLDQFVSDRVYLFRVLSIVQKGQH